MIVSIFTDASVNHETSVAGYAFYIGCKLGKIQKAGKLKVQTTDISMAELHCICNAVYTLTRSKFEGIKKVYIFTDSKTNVDTFDHVGAYKTKEKRELVEELRFLMMEFCIRFGFSIRDYRNLFVMQHVPAHTGGQDKHSLINNWCDKNARKYTKTPKNASKSKSKPKATV